MTLYQEKSADYFSRARTEIAPLLKGRQGLRALEVGCSQGHTLAWLKAQGYCSWVAGVEPFTELDVPAGVVDAFSAGNIEERLPDIPPASLDLILCLDVLEHLVDPWETVKRLDTLLKPGGQFIISVPNIRNYRVVADLLLRGRFEYTHCGILDRTHLRFFTRRSALDLAQASGARVEKVLETGIELPQKKLCAHLGFRDLLAIQFVISARKPA